MDKIVLKDKHTKEPLMVIEGDEVTITEAGKKKRKNKKKPTKT